MVEESGYFDAKMGSKWYKCGMNEASFDLKLLQTPGRKKSSEVTEFGLLLQVYFGIGRYSSYCVAKFLLTQGASKFFFKFNVKALLYRFRLLRYVISLSLWVFNLTAGDNDVKRSTYLTLSKVLRYRSLISLNVQFLSSRNIHLGLHV